MAYFKTKENKDIIKTKKITSLLATTVLVTGVSSIINSHAVANDSRNSSIKSDILQEDEFLDDDIEESNNNSIIETFSTTLDGLFDKVDSDSFDLDNLDEEEISISDESQNERKGRSIEPQEDSEGKVNVLSETLNVALDGLLGKTDSESFNLDNLDDEDDKEDEDPSWFQETLDIIFAGLSPKSIVIEEDDIENDEEDEVMEQSQNKKTSSKSKSTKETSKSKIPLLFQGDSRWGSKPYGTSNITISGCGVTSVAMVVSGLTDQTVTPDEVAAWAGPKYYVKGAGSSWALFTGAAEKWNLNVKQISKQNTEEILNNLKKGNPIIVSMDKGYFTTGGHILVLSGVTEDGKIIINDPASRKNSEAKWDLSFLVNQAKKTTNYCMWVYSKK